ncbi:MAG TPA: hypothetical protein VN310_15460 [Candidatus Dormibacteraeota bacterium]|jgi:hypothetical protein|nr:hypothetical protein [Candidatus Dormibacteraeota bacterium]
MRPEQNVKKKVLALERRRAQVDALIDFVKSHPLTAYESTLLPLNSRPGLYFEDFAIIRPLWSKGRVVLRLEKHAENWLEIHPEDWDPFDFRQRTVCEDVSRMTDKKVLRLLDKVHCELIPEDYEDEEE